MSLPPITTTSLFHVTRFAARMWPIGCWALVSVSVLHAEENWVDKQVVGPFLVRSEIPLDESLPRELEQLQHDLEQILGLNPSHRTIEISIFRHKKSYTRHVELRVPSAVRRRALYINGPDMGHVYVYQHSQLKADLRHETTHALLHNALPFVPVWIDEGLAEYFEIAADQRSSGGRHTKRLRWAIRLGWRPDLRKLESKRGLDDMTKGDYREALAWGHFMLHGPAAARQIFQGYLREIEQQTLPNPPSMQFEEKMPDFERQLTSHLKTWKD